jgi:hypothetical protein
VTSLLLAVGMVVGCSAGVGVAADPPRAKPDASDGGTGEGAQDGGADGRPFDGGHVADASSRGDALEDPMDASSRGDALEDPMDASSRGDALEDPMDTSSRGDALEDPMDASSRGDAADATGDGAPNLGWTKQTDIEKIFATYCSGCHGTAWASCWSVQEGAASIESVVSSGAMPRGATMSSSDKTTLLAWLDAGAPCTGTPSPYDAGGGGTMFPFPLGGVAAAP